MAYMEGRVWFSSVVTVAVIFVSFLAASNLLFPKKKGNFTIDASPPLPESSDAPASSSQGYDYEVFLSFRGDTRTGFTDYLYNDLIDAGIRAYRDNEELRVGEKIRPELLAGIKSSKICIPIFSKGYASGKWCLLELSQMAQCMSSTGQTIVSIFYNVEPADVRHQTGSYKKAFQEHEKRFDDQTVLQWREALRDVGTLKELELKKIADGNEGGVVKMVVAKVWKDLKKNYMVVSNSLVGIYHHVETMKRLLAADSGGVQVVGIHGMGGIGKTTIAKVTYNQLSESFESSCFLTDIRESSQGKGLVDLQNQLISNVLKRRNLTVSSVDEGINVIKETFCNKKVLIVLDDVHEREQLDALAQKRAWFGSGSRIIVTTRNKDALNVHDLVDRIYEPKEMDENQALQLLCKHAFRSDRPPIDYVELSGNVASTTGGLPLALEIIGSFLSGKRKDVWESTLKKLKRIPNDKVQEKLKLSYDDLDYEQQQIFLDIACMLIGEDKRVASHMWDRCEFYPENSIEVLVDMSLVKIGDKNELRMHDQLRDLGRVIVRQENYSELGERSRLWSHEEALNVLEECQGTRRVVAMCLDFKERSFESSITNKEFEKLANLRFLQLDFTCLVGDFRGLLSKLIWLRWHGIQDSFMPMNFFLKNLAVLDLSGGSFTDDWDGWEKMKVAKKLKVLNLSHCAITATPDFTAYADLEELILEDCKSLVVIDPSIWNLKHLRQLNFSNTSIIELPKDIGMLKKLEELDASDCLSLKGEIPGEIENLSHLRVLRLANTKICSLPVGVHLLSQLKYLDLGGCIELQSLPPELPRSLVAFHVTCKFMTTCSIVSNLVGLETLHFSYCSELLQIPREICALSRLQELKFVSCNKLQFILGLPSSLLNLSLDIGESLEMLELPNLQNLSGLKLAKCPKLVDIKGLENLNSLRGLSLTDCGKLPHLSILSKVVELQRLAGYMCDIAHEIGDVEILTILEKVEGPCNITCQRIPSESNLQEQIRLQIAFNRNLPLESSNAGDDPRHRISFSCETDIMRSLGNHNFADDTEDQGGYRKLTFWRPACFFQLTYGSRKSGSSFLDYLQIDDNLSYEIFSHSQETKFQLEVMQTL